MATGIEVAGLVLGSIPLLILAIEKWHKGFVKARDIAGLTGRDRERMAAKISGLVTALKSHSGQLNINLKALLKAADPSLDLESLPQDYRDQLWKGSTAKALKDYLQRMGGEDAVAGFRGEIEVSKLIVEELGRHFRQGKGNEPAKAGLREICDMLTRRSVKRGFRERFGFTLHEKDIDRLTKDLGHMSLSIASFVASATNLDKLAGQAVDKSTEGIKSIVNRLYKTRDYSLSLFNTLKGSWLAHCKHRLHNALLHLQSDCKGNSHLSKKNQEFHILFQIRHEGESSDLWRELVVVMNDDLPGKLSAPVKRTPLVTIVEDSGDLHDEVKDICHQISFKHTKDDMICFHVSDDDKLYWVRNQTSSISYKAQKRERILPKAPTLVPLRTYLTTDCRKLLDSKRVELAIKLGCSILQYNCTPWFARGLRKEFIYFFSDTTKQSLIDVDHPLISESFPCTESPAGGVTPEPQETLLEFAILLMELYHRTTFEQWMDARFPEVDQKLLEDEDYKRTYALKWRKEMPRHADFWDVVSVCLFPYPLEQHGEESWEDTEWRFAFYKFVISPLLGQ